MCAKDTSADVDCLLLVWNLRLTCDFSWNTTEKLDPAVTVGLIAIFPPHRTWWNGGLYKLVSQICV